MSSIKDQILEKRRELDQAYRYVEVRQLEDEKADLHRQLEELDKEMAVTSKDNNRQIDLADTLEVGIFSKNDEKKLMRDLLQIKTEAKVLSEKRSELDRELNEKHILQIAIVRQCRELKAKVAKAKKERDKLGNAGKEIPREITGARIDELRNRVLAVEKEKSKYEKFFEEDMSRMELIRLELKKESAQLDAALKEYKWIQRQNQVKLKDYARVKRYREALGNSNGRTATNTDYDLMEAMMIEEKKELMMNEELKEKDKEVRREQIDKEYNERLRIEREKLARDDSKVRLDNDQISKQALTGKDKVSNVTTQKVSLPKIGENSNQGQTEKASAIGNGSQKAGAEKNNLKTDQPDKNNQPKVPEKTDKIGGTRELSANPENKKSDIQVIDNSKPTEDVLKAEKLGKVGDTTKNPEKNDASGSIQKPPSNGNKGIDDKTVNSILTDEQKQQLEKDNQLKMTSKTPTFSDPSKIPGATSQKSKEQEDKKSDQTANQLSSQKKELPVPKKDPEMPKNQEDPKTDPSKPTKPTDDKYKSTAEAQKQPIPDPKNHPDVKPSKDAPKKDSDRLSNNSLGEF